jgi:hypothetical protein
MVVSNVGVSRVANALRIEDIIDLDRYPLQSQSAERDRLIADCRAQLASNAACCLTGFLRSDVVDLVASEVAPLVETGFRHTCEHNVYFIGDDPSFSAEHPRRALQRSAKHNIAGDLIARDALLRRVYEYEGLRSFLAAVIGEDRLYLQADPLSSLNVMIYGTGDRFGWHFDRTPYSVTIMLQEPEAGGAFQYVPYLRKRREAEYGDGVNEQVIGDAEDEDFERLSEILRGSERNVVDMEFAAGTMSILYGRHSLHRVTPVEGPRPRIMAILAYEPRPGVMFNDETRIRFYGRAR